MWHDDEDADGEENNEPITEAGDYNVGEDIGARVDKGHDPDTDPV